MASPLQGSLAATIGRAFNSLFLDATLTRDMFVTNSPDDSFDPPTPTPTDYACKAMRATYGLGYLRDSLVEAGDVKIVILQTSLSIDPLPGDRIIILGFGGPWTIVPANSSGLGAVTADPANAIWQCRARA